VADRKALGMLTPSSNTTLEPVCAQMLVDLPEVSVHFGRFRVTEISLSEQALGQFDLSAQLAAAELLADAKCDVICWNGTSASWLGLEHDRRLCQAITERTGIAACSSVLALDEVFRMTGVGAFGLVSPYVDEIQTRIVANFASYGYVCTGERHCGIKVNYDFATIDDEALRAMVRDVARSRPKAITILCTNMRGAPLVEALERELGIPVYDSVALALWASLRAVGIDPARVQGWGRLFQQSP
jgi:maleate isomerase